MNFNPWAVYFAAEEERAEAYRRYKAASEQSDRSLSELIPMLKKGRYDITEALDWLCSNHTHRQIAKGMGVSPASVSRWRNGRACKWESLRSVLKCVPRRYWGSVRWVE